MPNHKGIEAQGDDNRHVDRQRNQHHRDLIHEHTHDDQDQHHEKDDRQGRHVKLRYQVHQPSRGAGKGEDLAERSGAGNDGEISPR